MKRTLEQAHAGSAKATPVAAEPLPAAPNEGDDAEDDADQRASSDEDRRGGREAVEHRQRQHRITDRQRDTEQDELRAGLDVGSPAGPAALLVGKTGNAAATPRSHVTCG